MKLFITALFDEEVRKQIREHVLGEARGVARSEINNTLKAEVERIARSIASELDPATKTMGWRVRNLIQDTVITVLRTNWNSVGKDVADSVEFLLNEKLKAKIDQITVAAVEKEVAKKLRTKTVWEAKSQDDYVRQVVRSELKKMLKDM